MTRSKADGPIEGGALRPVAAASLSAVVPGAGHLYAGARGRGWIMIGITAALVLPLTGLLALVLFVTGPRLALTVSRPFFESPWLLLVLLAANLAVLGFRLFAVADSFRLAAAGAPAISRGTSALIAVGGLLFVAGLTLIPHVWAGSRNLALYDLFTHDFVSDPAAAPPPTTEPPPAPSSTTTTTTLPEDTTTTGAGASTTIAEPTTTTSTTLAPVVTTTGPPSSPFEGDERVNILFMGGDAGPDRGGIRTDSMIVASIDPTNGEVALFGVPRNYRNLPIPRGQPSTHQWECQCFPNLANAIYPYALAHPELFPGGPNAGANAAKMILGHLLKLDIQYFALVDMLGFIDVIDAIGGVRITVTYGVYDELYTQPDGDEVPVSLPPGTYDMNGETALAFARVRRGQSDYFRMDRQRCVLEALADEADPITLLRRLPYLVPAIQGSILTDIPVADWPDMLELLDRTDTDNMISVRFIPGAPELAGTDRSYIDGYTADRHPIPDVREVRRTVRLVIEEGAEQAGLRLGLPNLDETCGG